VLHSDGASFGEGTSGEAGVVVAAAGEVEELVGEGERVGEVSSQSEEDVLEVVKTLASKVFTARDDDVHVGSRPGVSSRQSEKDMFEVVKSLVGTDVRRELLLNGSGIVEEGTRGKARKGGIGSGGDLRRRRQGLQLVDDFDFGSGSGSGISLALECSHPTIAVGSRVPK